MSTKIWLGRLGKSNLLAQECFEKDIFAVGWNVTEKQLAKILTLLPKEKNESEDIIKNNFNDPGGSLKRFLLEADKGDYILCGPVDLLDEGEWYEYYLIGKINSKPRIPEKDEFDDSMLEGGINIVREVKWKRYYYEIPKGLRDYIGRNHHTFATNRRFDHEDIDKLFKVGEINEFKNIEKANENYCKEILEFMNKMDAFDFEIYVKDLLVENNWQVELTQRSGDKGIDIFGNAHIFGNFKSEVIVQVKRYQGKVKDSFIKDFQSLESPQESYEQVNPIRVFITTGTYTDEALKQAANRKYPQVITIDGEALVELATKTNMVPGFHWFPKEEGNQEEEG